MQPTFRCGTKEAITELAEALNLPYNNLMQDWPLEVIVADDIEIYITYYNILTNNDKKFVLMEGILYCLERQQTKTDFNKYWKIIKSLLETNFNTHEYTIHYWCCFETKKIADCFILTPFMRQVWKKRPKKLFFINKVLNFHIKKIT